LFASDVAVGSLASSGGGGAALRLASCWRARKDWVLPRTAEGVKGWLRKDGLSAPGERPCVGERSANESSKACVRAEVGEVELVVVVVVMGKTRRVAAILSRSCRAVGLIWFGAQQSEGCVCVCRCGRGARRDGGC
jgi:hypothetical protein